MEPYLHGRDPEAVGKQAPGTGAQIPVRIPTRIGRAVDPQGKPVLRPLQFDTVPKSRIGIKQGLDLMVPVLPATQHTKPQTQFHSGLQDHDKRARISS